MSNIERLSFVNNKIDAIEQLELTASNRIKSFHFVGNHLLDIPMTKDINIDGKAHHFGTANPRVSIDYSFSMI